MSYLSQPDFSHPTVLSEKLERAKGLTCPTMVMAPLAPQAFQHCHGPAEVEVVWGTLMWKELVDFRLRKTHRKVK